MNQKERKLAADLLYLAADEFANHGCNDWDWPADWSDEERRDFAARYAAYNGDDETYDTLPDFAVMGFLGSMLEGD
jgi:hypothetical protein